MSEHIEKNLNYYSTDVILIQIRLNQTENEALLTD